MKIAGAPAMLINLQAPTALVKGRKGTLNARPPMACRCSRGFGRINIGATLASCTRADMWSIIGNHLPTAP